MKIRELLTDESKWTQHTYAKDQNGNSTAFNDEAATCFCLAGAVMRCYGQGTDAYYNTLARIAEEVEEIAGMSMVSWNDKKARTFAEVKALVERLDI